MLTFGYFYDKIRIRTNKLPSDVLKEFIDI